MLFSLYIILYAVHEALLTRAGSMKSVLEGVQALVWRRMLGCIIYFLPTDISSQNAYRFFYLLNSSS